jgi:hypothetical protein
MSPKSFSNARERISSLPFGEIAYRIAVSASPRHTPSSPLCSPLKISTFKRNRSTILAPDEIKGLKRLDADNPTDREKLRRAVLDLVAGRKMQKQ